MPFEGIRPIGDGLLEVTDERLKGFLVSEDINEVYDVEQTPFARGKFAAVRRAVHRNSGVHVAAKFLKRRRRAQSSDKEIKHEIAVLILCSDSEHIVKLNAVHETRSDTALLLELATGGELQAILDEEGSLTEIQTRICLQQVLKALQFLHKRSIAHLDLKPQNILLTGKKVEDGLKLCDFGISRVIENDSKVREILGTPDYVAPEVLQYEPLSLQTDIWSVGVLAYVLLSGFSPFGGNTKQETFLNISQCSLTFPEELFEGISPYALDFIKSTLRIKSSERLSALECLEHVWLKEELPTSSKYLSTSCKIENLPGEENNLDIKDNKETTDEDIIRENGYKKCKSTASNDDDEYDKENFLTNTSKNNSINIIGDHNNGLVNSISAQFKVSSHRYDNEKFVCSDSCTLVKNSQNSFNDIEVIQNTLNNVRNITNNGGNKTLTSASICLFPDAPTTPKVIRKAPTEDSPRSVKDLVKKFQLEKTEKCIDFNGCEDNIDNKTSSCLNNENENNISISNNSVITNDTKSDFQNICLLCVASCSNTGCRHLVESSISNTKATNIEMDHRIIC